MSICPFEVRSGPGQIGGQLDLVSTINPRDLRQTTGMRMHMAIPVDASDPIDGL